MAYRDPPPSHGDAPNGGDPPPLTPTQQRTLTELLAVGAARPYAPAGLAGELAARVADGTAAAAAQWTERRLFLTKGMLTAAHRCEGQTLADEQRSRDEPLPLPALVGIVSHRAIQIAHTHPGKPVGSYVDLAIGAGDDEAVAEAWQAADAARQSDLRQQAVDRVAAFLDSWPPLREEWTPRFEHRLQARVGAVTLSARPDLALGRPRGDGRQSMLLCDLKTGALGEHHAREAMFYALVATLRNEVPPFRSTVYSLASGEHTDPDVTVERLRAAADWVVDGATRLVAIRTEQRAAELTPGPHCRWCPLRQTCPAADPDADPPDGGPLEQWPVRDAAPAGDDAPQATPPAASTVAEPPGDEPRGDEQRGGAAGADQPAAAAPTPTPAGNDDARFNIDDLDDDLDDDGAASGA